MEWEFYSEMLSKNQLNYPIVSDEKFALFLDASHFAFRSANFSRIHGIIGFKMFPNQFDQIMLECSSFCRQFFAVIFTNGFVSQFVR